MSACPRAGWRLAGAPRTQPPRPAQRTGAPSFPLFGSFFPAWMFCALFGVLTAIGARVAFVVLGKGDVYPFQLFVCTSIGVCFAFAGWLIWFGR